MRGLPAALALKEPALARPLDLRLAELPALPVTHRQPAALRFAPLAALSCDPIFQPHPRRLPIEPGLRSTLSAQGSLRDLALLPSRSSAFLQENPAGWDARRHHEGYLDQWGFSYDVTPVHGLTTEVRLWNDFQTPKFRILISRLSIDQMLERLTILKLADLSLNLAEKCPHVRCGSGVRRDDHVLKPPE